MRRTLQLIGRAIRKGSTDLRIRNRAAALASTAPRKDYLAQARKIFDGFLSGWRYVKDPTSKELLSFSPDALWQLVIGGDGRGAGAGYGVGDCDCATAALGALYESVGFPIRIATTSPIAAPAGDTFGHVFPQVLIPRIGWVTADPVLAPIKGFGEVTPHSRLGIWDLDGRLLGASGNYQEKKKEISPCSELQALGMVIRISKAINRMMAF